MSTDDADRQLGEPIPPTDPNSDSEDAIGTPAAAFETMTIPDEVDLSVEAIAEGMVALRIRSVTMKGKIILDTDPAADLAADVEEAVAAAENWERDQ